MSSTQKKVCLFTGASGPLGETFWQMFGSEYHMAAVYCNTVPQAVSQLQWRVDPLSPGSDLEENQNAVYAIQADLTNEEDLRRAVEVCLARYQRIDVLVNAAANSAFAQMLEGDALQESFERQFHINVLLPLRLSCMVADNYWKNREVENRRLNRSVVNVSSTSGLYIYPGRGQSLYSASKAALNYLTLHMADEFSAIGVRVNALAPTSFPSLIPIETAAEGIHRLIESDVTGKILVQDVNGERWT
jgi:NAD(P)-dependent dehydrogenase (short-subunit alcohol dehydrogenase family)